MWNVLIPQGERGTDALVQQIPGEYQVKLLFRDTCFFRKRFKGQLLQLFFSLFLSCLLILKASLPKSCDTSVAIR